MTDESTDVLFFCLGNICRSPLAEGLFRHKIEERGLDGRFTVVSAGTSSYHVGEAPDPGSRRVARERLGRDISHQRSQQLTAEDLEAHDWSIAMDQSNRTRAARLSDQVDADDIHLIREFDPKADGDLDVPDPYGGEQDQFDLVYDILDRSTDELLDHILADR